MKTLAIKLGITQEQLNTCVEEYMKDKHISKTEAEQHVYKQYVEQQIFEMKDKIKDLQTCINIHNTCINYLDNRICNIETYLEQGIKEKQQIKESVAV